MPDSVGHKNEKAQRHIHISEEPKKPKHAKRIRFNFTSKYLAWIQPSLTWRKFKPVIRCAVAAWLASVLFVIPRVMAVMGGQATFLILIASFLSPPTDPFRAVVEREVVIMIMISLTWSYVCVGIRFADMARTVHDPSATFVEAVSGKFIEAGPTVIMGVFVGVGSAVILYIKARQGPGPFTFACIFSCICLDVSLTTAVLFPFPFYLIGRAVVLPLVFHSALAILCSLTIFPSTISAQFTQGLQGVLSPLITALDMHRALLKTPTVSHEFLEKVEAIKNTVARAEGAVVALVPSARLLPSDIIYCRFAPGDFMTFQDFARRIVGRAHGMGLYFTLIDPTRERFPVTPAPSLPGTPRPGTPSLELAGGVSPLPSRSHSRAPSENHPHPHHHVLHQSLSNLAKTRSKREHAVGVFESHRYLDIEATRLHDPNSEACTARTTELLSESCDNLLEVSGEGLKGLRDWFGGVRDGRFGFFGKKKAGKEEWQAKLEKLKELRERVFVALQEFREERRHAVLDSYLPAFDDRKQEMPPHRYLFNCYVYQYHLTQMAAIVLELLDEAIKLESSRLENKLWTPIRTLKLWWPWDMSEHGQQDELDDNPNVVQGAEPMHGDLGIARRRDPDALPPRNVLEWCSNYLYLFLTRRGGNLLYAVKAGLFTVILCLPSFLPSSATFAFKNRSVWAIIMGQVTLSRFRGDTTYSLIARLVATFGGGVSGAVLWYISCGSAQGNAYGLATVCAVAFPIFFFVKLNCPIHPMTVTVYAVTVCLVIGYSYQDIHIPNPGSPGSGISVAWKRFVLVAIGVVAAFIFSLLPPSTTIRRYQRNSLATTTSEIGVIYCSIVSFAHSKNESEVQEIIKSLLAVRSKLKRSAALKANVSYEFSFRGRWPAKRYQDILDLQISITYSLSHLMSVVKHLDSNWTRAFLRRTRLTDSDFQGDVLAVLTMISTALRTGSPLPQITPCPLLDRFMLRYHGMNVIHKDAEEDYGLPRSLTLETLQNEQYLMFCVGVSTAYGIVNRLDRLMIAVKEVVGEQYHITGVGFMARGGSTLELAPSTLHYRPPRDV
ncbi:uncharacterized protein LACBIDRAFT_316563 [Laccaria bicolor S238N-H82]|uniref:Predicted protein n=1 Tax=Laccaria bicolor (strain S238N-H82 / ATCC MYA-4686) TaxID=486041 RepID=B0E156_LACBS|nr:uncharacterized protein LACBIDRAFT_316563 [Laccaria bicolor S238N-H82]EDQ99398.1 predicted protein [Laccaria bicolor S238N-H82]|eukprot:XP_001889949.1 predicted protein [Laccaria bicolor S238N-H82]